RLLGTLVPSRRGSKSGDSGDSGGATGRRTDAVPIDRIWISAARMAPASASTTAAKTGLLSPATPPSHRRSVPISAGASKKRTGAVEDACTASAKVGSILAAALAAPLVTFERKYRARRVS